MKYSISGHFRRLRYISLLAIVTFCLSGVQGRSQEALTIDGVAAHVNRHVVTIGEIYLVVERLRPQLAANYRGAELQDQLRNAYVRTLNSLIERYLVLDAYQAGEAKLPGWVMEQRIAQHIAETYDGEKSNLLDELQKRAKTYGEWRSEFEERLIVLMMRSTFVDQNVVVPPLEVRQQYETHRDRYKRPTTYRVSMIAITPKADEVAAGRERAEAALARIRAGEAFADVAKMTSDAENAEAGGDIDWVEAREVRPVLRDTLTALDVGQTSSIVHAEGVFYILYLADRKLEQGVSFESAQPAIERELREKQSDIVYRAWLGRLRDAAYVRVFDVKL